MALSPKKITNAVDEKKKNNREHSYPIDAPLPYYFPKWANKTTAFRNVLCLLLLLQKSTRTVCICFVVFAYGTTASTASVYRKMMRTCECVSVDNWCIYNAYVDFMYWLRAQPLRHTLSEQKYFMAYIFISNLGFTHAFWWWMNFYLVYLFICSESKNLHQLVSLRMKCHAAKRPRVMQIQGCLRSEATQDLFDHLRGQTTDYQPIMNWNGRQLAASSQNIIYALTTEVLR